MQMTTISKNPSHAAMKAMALALFPSMQWRHHGIGVLQGYIVEDAQPEVRLHVWARELLKPGMDVSGDIHDHRFDMVSHVLVGDVGHEEIHPEANGDGLWRMLSLTHARAAKDTGYHGPTAELDGHYNARRVVHLINEGAHPSLPSRSLPPLGSILTGVAVTVVEKHNQSDEAAADSLPGPHAACDGVRPRDGLVGHRPGPPTCSRSARNMSLPRFKPAPPPTIQLGGRLITDHGNAPHCSACGEWGPCDVVTGLCRACWRVGPWAAEHLEARGLGSAAQEELRVLRRENGMLRDFVAQVPRADVEVILGMKLPPDDLARERERRDVPRLTDASGAAGVTLAVDLEPASRPKLGPPRERLVASPREPSPPHILSPQPDLDGDGLGGLSADRPRLPDALPLLFLSNQPTPTFYTARRSTTSRCGSWRREIRSSRRPPPPPPGRAKLPHPAPLALGPHRLVQANLRYVVRVALSYQGERAKARDLIHGGPPPQRPPPSPSTMPRPSRNLGPHARPPPSAPQRPLSKSTAPRRVRLQSAPRRRRIVAPKLVTYAGPWINAYIRKHILANKRPPPPPPPLPPPPPAPPPPPRQLPLALNKSKNRNRPTRPHREDQRAADALLEPEQDAGQARADPRRGGLARGHRLRARGARARRRRDDDLALGGGERAGPRAGAERRRRPPGLAPVSGARGGRAARGAGERRGRPAGIGDRAGRTRATGAADLDRASPGREAGASVGARRVHEPQP